MYSASCYVFQTQPCTWLPNCWSVLLMQFEILCFIFLSQTACIWLVLKKKILEHVIILYQTESFCTKQEIMQWWFRLCARSGSQPGVCVRTLLTCVFFSHSDAGITPIITTITTSGELLHTPTPCLPPSVCSQTEICWCTVFCRKYIQQRRWIYVCLCFFTLPLARSLTHSLSAVP